MWLEAGREGQVFTYGLTADQPVLPGDLVRVRLRGRPLHGLVVATREANAHSVDAEKRCLAIEEIVQREAVAPEWREWVESVAVRCHLSAFRTLKAALPVGWLGQARSLNEQVLWWVSIRQLDGGEEVTLTQRQQQLIDYFLENVSERQALVMKDDMEVATPKPVVEVEAAKKSIVRQARKLQEAGEIIMSAGDSSDYV